MRAKAPRLVVTFHTTAEAMATERLCRREGLPGQLISVPRCLTSDCGIAWSAPTEVRSELEEKMRAERIDFAGFHEVLL